MRRYVTIAPAKKRAANELGSDNALTFVSLFVSSVTRGLAPTKLGFKPPYTGSKGTVVVGPVQCWRSRQ